MWVFSLIADVAFLITKNPSWSSAAFLTMVGGLMGAVAAAVPGLIDFTGIDEPRTKRVAVFHMVINLIVVALYGANLGWRLRTGVSVGPVALSVVTIGLLSVSGWLGGALVYEHGMGVDMGESKQPARRAAGRR
jgi:uncharacterized membrane protein